MLLTMRCSLFSQLSQRITSLIKPKELPCCSKDIQEMLEINLGRHGAPDQERLTIEGNFDSQRCRSHTMSHPGFWSYGARTHSRCPR